jgi:20S proteasome alpha/beta subunit
VAASDTLIAALKFKGGVIIGSDSQASDDINKVRWPMEKPEQIGNFPLVVACSGAAGRGKQAVAALQNAGFHDTTFQKPERVMAMVDGKLKPIYNVLKQEAVNNFPKFPYPSWQIVLSLLGAYWAGGQAHILECCENGDYPFPHDYFHAIGSAGQTAYTVFRTLGGKRLAEVDEPLAILAIIRILRTSINVEVEGVSEPVFVWIIRDGKARKLTETEINFNTELVARWEREDQEHFLARSVQIAE